MKKTDKLNNRKSYKWEKTQSNKEINRQQDKHAQNKVKGCNKKK